jgi:iron(III) transport system permease protein
VLAPRALLTAALVALLAYLILVPLAAVVRSSMIWHPGDVRLQGVEVEVGAPTTYHWTRVFASPLTRNLLVLPLLRTLAVAAGVVVIVLAVGGALAWFVTRTDVAFQRVIAALATLPYMLPSWALAMAWLAVFRNQGVGAPAGFVEFLTGWQAPEWLVYGGVPIAITLGLHYFPFGYLFLSAALRHLDAELEESADVLGLGRWQVLRAVTVPLVRPAVLSVALLAFARAIGTFGTPAILGLPVRFHVMSTQIYALTLTGREGQAYVLALVLMALAACGLLVNARMVGTRRSYATVGGKGGRSRRIRLGRWRVPLGVGALAFLLLAGILPLGLLTWSSLMRNLGDFSPGNLTLHHWVGAGTPGINDGQPGILRNPQNLMAIWNSVRLGLLGGAICGILGLLVGYVVVRGRSGVVAQFLEQTSFVPMLIPSIAFGAVYLAVFGRGGWVAPPLYGTFALLVLVTVGKQLPYAARAGISAQMQIARELEDAAAVLDVPWYRRWAHILFPLTRPAFLAGALIVFMTTVRELSLYVLLVSPRTPLMAAQAYWYTEVGFRQLADAFTVLLVLVVLAVTAATALVERRSRRLRLVGETG